jgi:hypothetical protein
VQIVEDERNSSNTRISSNITASLAHKKVTGNHYSKHNRKSSMEDQSTTVRDSVILNKHQSSTLIAGSMVIENTIKEGVGAV